MLTGTIPPAGVRHASETTSAPDDHFTAGPDCRVTASASGRVRRAGGSPSSRAGMVSPAGVQKAGIRPRRSFHCRSRLPCDVLEGRARWSCWWLSNYRARDCISRPCLRPTVPSSSAPNDHFTAGPDCRVTKSGIGRVGRAGGCPTIRAGIVSPARVQKEDMHHPRRSFHCRSRLPCEGLGQRARWSCWWLSNYPCWDCISRRCSRGATFGGSAPDDHFAAGPDCRVTASARGRVGRAGGCPAIRAGVVSPASVLTAAAPISTPDDHFTAGPDCRVIDSGLGRVGRAGGCPTIRAGIVASAGV